MESLRKIIMCVAVIILAIIIVSAITLSIVTLKKLPTPPVLINSTSESEQNSKLKEIENYKTIVSLIQNQNITVYEKIVINTLYPLLNTLILSILGYAFAKTSIEAYKIYLTEKKNLK